MSPRLHGTLLWVLAVLITLAAAVYQRVTGPTYPVSGSTLVGQTEIEFKLKRTHAGATDHLVEVAVPDGSFLGHLRHRRHDSTDEWTRVEMTPREGKLTAALPHQEPAGKLDYQVFLSRKARIPEAGAEAIQTTTVPLTDPITIRFRDPVPIGVMIPHVLLIFLAMLTSNRAGFEALRRGGDPRRLTVWTFWLMLVGGILVGMVVQQYSFRVLWTGFPLGGDITDSKTLFAQIFWLIALLAGRRSLRAARGWAIAAAVATFIIFVIPHSMS